MLHALSRGRGGVLSVDRDPDYQRISSWNASGFSAQTRASLLCSNVVDCIELLLPPWFCGEGVVRQCRVVRGTTTSGKPSRAAVYFLRVRLSTADRLAVDISLTNCCWHQTSPTPRKCRSCNFTIQEAIGVHDFSFQGDMECDVHSARMCTQILYRQTARTSRTVSKMFMSS